MTEKEYEILCYIIDKNTKKVAGQYDDYTEIDSRGIKKIKKEVCDLLVNNREENANTKDETFIGITSQSKGKNFFL